MPKGQTSNTMRNIKTVSDLLSDVVNGFGKTSIVQSLGEALPWAGLLGETLAEVLPPIKFLVKLFDKLTKEHDPEKLGYIACTIAYEQSMERAFNTYPEPAAPKEVTDDTKQKLEQAAQEFKEKTFDFKTFSRSQPFDHPFVKESGNILDLHAQALGYDDAERRKIIEKIHACFPGNLNRVLSHGKTREKFIPFTQMMQIQGDEARIYEALQIHADYQRWLFEEEPLFSRDPFALTHVYVDTECGKLPWKELRAKMENFSHIKKYTAGDKADIFSESFGGRHPLLETVKDYFGDKDFRDAVVIMGSAGSGKSAFTLRLCSELIREGMRPIRIRLKDLRFDRHVSEAMTEAVRISGKGFLPGNGSGCTRPDNLFLNGKIFRESIRYRDTLISPYVLILDGWDEINISVSEGFKKRMDRMLEQIRSEYLGTKYPYPVRVILTGRPCREVMGSGFMLGNTPILTMRPFQPAQLGEMLEKIKSGLDTKPVEPAKTFDNWEIKDTSIFKPVLDQYKKDYENHSGAMEVMGLPLLAILAIRLMSQWKGNLTELVENSTILYRHLTDLTCKNAGQVHFDPHDTSHGEHRVFGGKLRHLLWKAAGSMTIFGEENISYNELERRLKLRPGELSRQTGEATEQQELSSLMISFYFKGGHTDLGCEFLHKSFREYLCAEGIVEMLKEFGAQYRDPLPPRPTYWKDFETTDPRYKFSRDLAKLLAPQWMTSEIAAYLEQLIKMELERSGAEDQPPPVGLPTEVLDIEGWEAVADGLADIWEWWAEGVHMRPQPKRDDYTRALEFLPPFADELVRWAAPLFDEGGPSVPAPTRTISMDAHLGDALLRLTALVHYFLNVRLGFTETRKKIDPQNLEWKRNYQVLDKANPQRRIFAPGGSNPDYFTNFLARIDGSGWRPLGKSGTRAFLCGVYLHGKNLNNVVLYKAKLDHAVLSDSDLSGADLCGAKLNKVDLSESNLSRADLSRTNLSGSNLNETTLSGTDLRGSDLSGSKLTRAVLSSADLSDAVLYDADIRGSYFYDANLNRADLTSIKNRDKANLEGARGI